MCYVRWRLVAVLSGWMEVTDSVLLMWERENERVDGWMDRWMDVWISSIGLPLWVDSLRAYSSG